MAGCNSTAPENSAIHRDLMLLNRAVNYRAWLAEKVRPYIGRRILEAGSGVGNFSQDLAGAEYLLATDIDPAYVRILEDRFADVDTVETMQMDIGNITPTVKAELKGKRFDTVLCMNVLEHVEDDNACVSGLLDLLVSGGRMILIVPAFPSLFNSLDNVYGHYRRYRKADFRRMAQDNGALVEKLNYFNIPGMLGWIWSGLWSRRNLPEKQTALFDKCIPLIRACEKALPSIMGLSLLAALQRD